MDDDYVWLDDDDAFDTEDSLFDYFEYMEDELECGVGSVDLAQFQDLRSLCWKGLNKYSDFECLKECIRAHGPQLLSLTLDLINWDHAKNRWTHEFRRQSDEGMPNNFLFRGL
ncbi:similar to An01g07930 [Aspergillus luchuensis]|uniref:Similar to An01g07930 n=1 Tax=Aspergillus kawachii TaxID=1069201 RepID=A0A146FA94_ASPKA|nr:similar to An01g07930 [Aspergillus luchuensis]